MLLLEHYFHLNLSLTSFLLYTNHKIDHIGHYEKNVVSLNLLKSQKQNLISKWKANTINVVSLNLLKSQKQNLISKWKANTLWRWQHQKISQKKATAL